MSPREIEQRVIAILRDANVEQRIGSRALRREVGCGTEDLTAAIKRMRMQGKIEWDSLLLSPSLRAEPETEAKAKAKAGGVADQVKAEAQVSGERRRVARGTGTVKRVLDAAPAPLTLTLVETVQSEIVADPRDMIRTVSRTHSALWQRILLLGRELGEHPALALYRVIEAGLDVVEADLAEGKAA